MAEKADVVIVGVGTSGEDLGLRLVGEGLDVVGISDELLGGECAYWACIPSKMMIRAADLLQEARRVDGVAGGATVDPRWQHVASRIRNEASGGWDDSVAVQRFESKGGRFIRGRGALVGPRTVRVGDRTFDAARGVVIATGSDPVIPPIPGLEETGYWTSHDAIQAEALPDSLLVLGGGATGCELGQVFARFGVDVTVVEGRERLLPTEEPEAGTALAAAFESEGITVRTDVRVVRVEEASGGVAAFLDDGTSLVVDRLLIAVGRRIDLGGLGLETAGVDGSGGSIPVDGLLRASDGVWAIGDVTGKPAFTHVALYQGRIAGEDILGRDVPPADYSAVPRATFTDPEVASVGMTEAEAREAGVDVTVTLKNLPNTFRGWLHGPGNAGLIKLVADRGSGRLVGATSVGAHGGEVLGLLSLAVHAHVPLADLRSMIYAFPTFHGAVGEATGAYALGLQDVLDPSGDRSLWA